MHLLMRKTGAGRVFGAKCTDYDHFKYRSQMESQMDLNCTLVNQLLVLYSHKLYIWGRLHQFRKRFTHNWWKQELGKIFVYSLFQRLACIAFQLVEPDWENTHFLSQCWDVHFEVILKAKEWSQAHLKWKEKGEKYSS